jgi:hydrogenase nickel incorporation protein HypA/HybF
MQCSASVPIFSRLDLCPLCEGAQLQATGGTELKVVDMRVV